MGDLLVGSVGFAILQRWGRKNTERLLHESGGDEIIYDVVILDNGARADVIGSRQIQFPEYPRDDVESETHHAASFMSPGKDEEVFGAVPRRSSIVDALDSPHLAGPLDNQPQISDEDIRLYIMRQLPRGSHASIRSDLVSARTITVDIYDDDNAEIAAPPGTKMIEERFHNDQDIVNNNESQRIPRHSVVFRTAFNRSHSADVTPHMDEDSRITTGESGGHPGPFSVSRYIFGPGNGRTRSPKTVPHRSSDSEQLRPAKPASPIVSDEAHTRTKDASRALHKQTGENSAPSPLVESEAATKNTFGKGSFKWPSLKKPPMKSSPSSPGGSTQFAPSWKPTSENNALPQTPPIETSSEVMPNKPSSPRTQATSPAANKGLPRLPLRESSRDPNMRPVSSPTALNYSHHDSYSRKNSRNDRFPGREKAANPYMAPSSFHRQSDGIPSVQSALNKHHIRSNSSMSLTRSETGMAVSINNDGLSRPSTAHKRSKSYSSSIYSLATAGSDTSLVLAPRARKSAYEDKETIQALNRDGFVPGIFPENHFARNIRRFCRFSLASYGPKALKVMGGPMPIKTLPAQESDSHEHSAFSDSTGLPPSTILLSSFVDPAGGSNAVGETESGFPLVHYLCIDHESKAIVLTLRGTWGFEDILTDMTCDYDELEWQGKNWKVHKGMHASARRLLQGGGGRVMITIRAALEEYTDYGVILCGHSLGGGVAALLATMISEPSNTPSGTSFVTASDQSTRRQLITANGEQDNKPAYFLPSGRAIHVYAYGPPAVMAPCLRRATRGLITTIVNGQDVVPSLSLGILHDMHSVSLAFQSDASGAKSHVRNRIWDSLRQNIINKFYVNETPMLIHAGEGVGEDAWAWEALKMLREGMHGPKLMPPGEVFVVETMRVLQRDAFTSDNNEDYYPRLGRPATRVQLKFIRDAETVFGELRFGSGMLSDHNPVRYEASLAALTRGILDE